jgi:flagellar biosynthesis protein FlhG
MKRHRGRTSKDAPAGLRVVAGADAASGSEPALHPASWRRPRVPTIAFASGKGGVGKSHLAANLALALGQQGARVVLVDADFAQANLDLLLGVHPRYDLRHVLNGERSIEEIVVPAGRGVTLVPAASGAPELAELDDFRREVVLRSIGTLARDADLVLLDLASGVSRTVVSMCLAADEVVVTTTTEMPAFSDGYALMKLLHQEGLKRPLQLVVSMASASDEADETAHRIRLVARRFLQIDVPFLGSIPYDPSVPRALRNQEPVLTAFPRSPSAAAYAAMAALLWGTPEPEPSIQEPVESRRLLA